MSQRQTFSSLLAYPQWVKRRLLAWSDLSGWTRRAECHSASFKRKMERPLSAAFPEILPVPFSCWWRHGTAPATHQSTFIYKEQSHIQRCLEAQSKEKAAAVGRKSSSVRRNLEQTPDSGGRPTALSGRGEEEIQNNGQIERQSGREAREGWSYTLCGFIHSL